MTEGIRHGITGNYYIVYRDRMNTAKLCIRIGKSERSIYFSARHKMWVARIKNKKQKQKLKLKEIKDEQNL